MAKKSSKKKNLTFVIDTNVFVISLTSRSPYHVIYKNLIAGNFDLLVSNDISLEYEEVITQKYGRKTADIFLGLLHELPNVTFIVPYFKWGLIEADHDDDKYVDCAIAGLVDYIISEDNHFNILKSIPFPIVNVIKIDEFIELLQQNHLQ
ncbi:MAG: putative toxin-antitoxin system toxin component, PIN family [Bacteroidia bacterium]|nr:putative toxin-antitoxin system toxin component, PIN family [Bacteroidia bacterium]